jgi:hypothetical protein
MSLPSGTPPLLLTKRLTGFLHANQSPQLPTLLLTTPHGKLLAHASPQPVSVLRTHVTVAASLLAIHTSSSVAVPSALPGARTPDAIGSSSSPAGEDETDDNDDGARGGRGGRTGGTAAADGNVDEDDEDGDEDEDGARIRRPLRKAVKPVTITVQLSGGTVVVRRLKCGLLFVCVGPPATSDHYSYTPAAGGFGTGGTAAAAAAASASATGIGLGAELHDSSGDLSASVARSPSDADSLISAGGQTTTSL